MHHISKFIGDVNIGSHIRSVGEAKGAAAPPLRLVFFWTGVGTGMPLALPYATPPLATPSAAEADAGIAAASSSATSPCKRRGVSVDTTSTTL